MNDWTAGYVVDIEYSPGFYAEQMPAHLDAACLIRAVEPPVAPGAAFRYCELGCGQGETALTVAVSNPHAEVWAFDFNPAHIAKAQQMAAAGNIGNIRFEEKSFEELLEASASSLPLFDYVTLHGVWTWVSQENRAFIVEFLKRHLRPGGVVCVSYNALPGWAMMVPLQRLMLEVAHAHPGRSDSKALAAVQFIEAVAKAGGIAYEAKTVDDLKKHVDQDNLTYLAHEYLNDYWAPLFQTDVAAALAKARLEYAATANILENFTKLCLTGEQQALVDGAPVGMRETVKDYFMERSFRRDIYVRGWRAIPTRRLDERLRPYRLALLAPLGKTTRKIRIPLGEAELHGPFYDRAFEALAEGVRSVGELLDLPEARGTSVSAQEIIGMMVGSRQAILAPNDVDAAARDRVRHFNAIHLRACANESRSTAHIAGVAVGSGVPVRIFEMLAYEAIAQGVEPELETIAQFAARLLRERGDKLRHEDRQIENETETIDALRTHIAEVLATSLPMWKRIGAI